ncbi:MAG: copper chaperone PCu(A)C [Pseudomonadota bacterium]
MRTILALSLALAALPASAHEFKIADLVIGHPFATPTTASAKAGAGYMEITNRGDTPDRLVAVEAAFPQVMLHASVEKDGVARMVHLHEGVELLPGETVRFAPGGLHVMFMGLKGDPFEDGEKVPATLVFEKAGRLDVTFNVEKVAMKEMDHSMHGMASGS